MGYIYKATSKTSGKSYIGQTNSTIHQRFYNKIRGHVPVALDGSNLHFHRAIRKYGIDDFEITILETVDTDKLNEREKYWIAYYDTFNNGYNMTTGGDGSPGRVLSEETKQTIRDNTKEAMHRPEVHEKQINSLKEAMKRPEVRAKISKSNKGPKPNRRLTPEQKAARRQRMLEKGTLYHTEEAKRKISEASRNMSQETRDKISNALKGRKSPFKGKHYSEEARLAKSKQLKELYQNPELRKKIGEKVKAAFAKKREQQNGLHFNIEQET